MKTLILFRCNSAVHTVHGGNRPFGMSKDECSKICFNKLIKEIDSTFDIIVICDRVSEDLIEHFKNCKNVIDIIYSSPGNSSSAQLALSTGLQNINNYDLIYLLEDDHFHKDGFLKNVKEILNVVEDKSEFFIIPCSHKIHILDNIYNDIFLIRGSFFSFIASKKAFLKYYARLFFAASNYHVDDGDLWRYVYKHDLKQENRCIALAKYPFLAVHLHDHEESLIEFTKEKDYYFQQL